MNGKTFGILSVITLILIGLASQLTQKNTEQPLNVGQPLFPNLLNQLDKVTEIEIKQAQNPVVVSLQQNKWQVKQHANYPADVDKINKLLVNIAHMAIVEAKTQSPDSYAKLGVADDDNLVSLKQADGRVLARVFIGHGRVDKGDNSQHHYVRKIDDKQAWLATGQIDIPADAVDWLQRDLLDLSDSQIQAAQFHTRNNETLRFTKAKKEDDHYQLADLKETEKLSSDYGLKTLASTLSNLKLDGVLPAKELAFKAQENATFTTFDGLQIKVFLAEKQQKTYIKLQANSVAKEKSEAQQAKAIELNQKFSPWAYAVAQYKLDNFKKVRADLVELKPKPAEPAPEKTPPVAAPTAPQLAPAPAKKPATPAPIQTPDVVPVPEAKQGFLDKLKAAGSTAKTTAKTAAKEAGQAVSEEWGEAKEVVKEKAATSGQAAMQGLQSGYDKTKSAVQKAAESEQVQTVVDKVKSGVNTVVEKVKQGAEKVIETTQEKAPPAQKPQPPSQD
jgi:hypothetical protein